MAMDDEEASVTAAFGMKRRGRVLEEGLTDPQRMEVLLEEAQVEHGREGGRYLDVRRRPQELGRNPGVDEQDATDDVMAQQALDELELGDGDDVAHGDAGDALPGHRLVDHCLASVEVPELESDIPGVFVAVAQGVEEHVLVVPHAMRARHGRRFVREPPKPFQHREATGASIDHVAKRHQVGDLAIQRLAQQDIEGSLHAMDIADRCDELIGTQAKREVLKARHLDELVDGAVFIGHVKALSFWGQAFAITMTLDEYRDALQDISNLDAHSAINRR